MVETIDNPEAEVRDMIFTVTQGGKSFLLRNREWAFMSYNTIFIFSSDNGTSPIANFKELQDKGHFPTANLRGHKADIWEGGHRVPFVVRWPNGNVTAGSESDQLICLKGKWKLIFGSGSGGWSYPKNKQATKKGLPRVQLYNMETDISETTNLQGKHPEIVKELTNLLEAYIANGRSTSGEKLTLVQWITKPVIA